MSQHNNDSQNFGEFEDLMQTSWKGFCQDNDLNFTNFELFFADNPTCDIQLIKGGEFKRQPLNFFVGKLVHLEIQQNGIINGRLENPTGTIEAYFELTCFDFTPKSIMFSQNTSQLRSSVPNTNKGLPGETRNITFENAAQSSVNKPPFALGTVLVIKEPSVISIDDQNYFLLIKPAQITKFYWKGNC